MPGTTPPDNNRRTVAMTKATCGKAPTLNPEDQQKAGARRPDLPAELTSFVGRWREIAEVARLLAATRLVTLAGAGGVGKTRLALRVAESVRSAYPDGLWLVELASVADGSLVPQTVATVLGVRELPGESVVDTLANVLHRRQLLLILDNCEHLLASCVDLAYRLLRACPEVRILASSREVLGIGAETAWRVPPLSLPDPDATGPWTR